MEMDLSLILSFDKQNVVIIVIVLSSIFSKIISGYMGGRAAKFNHKNSLLFGVASMPQLTTMKQNKAFPGRLKGLLQALKRS